MSGHVAVRSNIFGRESQVAGAIGGTIRRFGEGVKETISEVSQIEPKRLERQKLRISTQQLQNNFDNALQNEQTCKQEKEKLIGEIETQFSGRSAKWVGGYRKILTSTTCDAAGFSKFNRYITDLDRMERTYQARPEGSNLRLYDAGEVFDPKAAERYESSGNKNVKTAAIGKDLVDARAILKKDGITPATHEVSAAIAALPPTLANKPHVFEDITKMFLTKAARAKIRNDTVRANAARTGAGARAAGKGADKDFDNRATISKDIKSAMDITRNDFKAGVVSSEELKKERIVINLAGELMSQDKTLTFPEARKLAIEQSAVLEEPVAEVEEGPARFGGPRRQTIEKLLSFVGLGGGEAPIDQQPFAPGRQPTKPTVRTPVTPERRGGGF